MKMGHAREARSRGVRTFLYFTRGCPRGCDFCESRRTQFECMDQESAFAMVEHYQAAGIRSLNFADDNLLLAAATRKGRDRLIDVFHLMRDCIPN